MAREHGRGVVRCHRARGNDIGPRSFLFRGRALGGAYFAVVTLCAAVIAQTLAEQSSFLGGFDGLLGIPPFSAPGRGANEYLTQTETYLVMCFASLVVYLALSYVIRSPVGTILAAIRDNEGRTTFFGYNIVNYKAGAFALSENNLYTTDAFRDYLLHLTDDGILAITRWGLEPPRESLRLISLAIEALNQLGETDAWRHVIVGRQGSVQGWGAQDTVLISRKPFSQGDIDRARIAMSDGGVQAIYYPGLEIQNQFYTLRITYIHRIACPSLR